jgi:hypothetical protein
MQIVRDSARRSVYVYVFDSAIVSLYVYVYTAR